MSQADFDVTTGWQQSGFIALKVISMQFIPNVTETHMQTMVCVMLQYIFSK